MGPRLNRLAAIACAFLAWWMLVPTAWAGDVSGARSLATCVAPARPGETGGRMLSATGGFDCAIGQTRHGPGDFWVRARPEPAFSTPQNPLRLRMGSVWQEKVTVHLRYADGHVARVAADQQGLTRRVQLGAILEFAVPVRPAPLTDILWHVQGSANMRGIVLGAKLVPAATSERANLSLAALYAGFAGLGLALITYNLALWRALRHGFQIAYCAMLGCLLVYAFSSSGALAWAFPEIGNNQRITLNYVMLCWATAAALLFSRRFFEPRIFQGWVGRLTDWAALAMAGLGLVILRFAHSDIRLLDTLYAYAFVAVVGVVLPILWRGWRRRSNYLWLFALCWASPLSMAVARSLQNLGILPWSFWLDSSTVIAMTAEALLTSLAIAYRIRLLSRERDEAVRQEINTRRLADTDPLTGLFNRRAFLSRAIGREEMQQLIVIDLDHFKRVNDAIGHDGGDEVLRVFARTLRQHLPSHALIARMGGEEFAVLTDASGGIDLDALLSAIRVAEMPSDLPVTASIGCCTGPLASDADWKLLYRHADAALFNAKAAGRDRARKAAVLRKVA